MSSSDGEPCQAGSPLCGDGNPQELIQSADQSLAIQARSMAHGRRQIGRFFRAELFGDPAFDMMLELFASAVEGVRLKVTAMAALARVPPTTGLRYIGLLEKEGLIERYSHPNDRRITFVRLTDTARTGMQRYLQSVATRR